MAQSQSQEPRNLLTIDLDANPSRDTITLHYGGEPHVFEVLSPDDFGLSKQKTLYQTTQELESYLNAKGNQASISYENATKKLDKFLLEIIPDLPRELLSRLKETAKLKIMQSFMKAVEDAASTANNEEGDGEQASTAAATEPYPAMTTPQLANNLTTLVKTGGKLKEVIQD